MRFLGDTARGGPVRVPATTKEKSLWLLEELVPGSGVNNLSFAFQAGGDLEAAALDRTVSLLVGRHAVFRTVFHVDDDGLSRETLAADRIEIPVEHRDSAREDLAAELTAFVGAPFAPDGGPLLRALHLRRADGDAFCLALHHAVFDGMSVGILLEEFAAVYEAFAEGRTAPAELLGEVPLWREPQPSERSRTFWRERLRGFDAGRLGLACDRVGAAETTLAGDQVTRVLSAEATAVTRRLQRELRAPQAVVLLAAYYALLAAHGAGPDLTVGSPLNVRGRERARTIGYHINVLTLRVLVDPARSFRDLVADVRDVFLDAVEHADFPVDDLLELVPRADASWRNSLFRHVFNYIPDGDQTDFKLAGAPARLLLTENGFSKFDLEFFVTDSAHALRVRAAYYTEAMERGDVELMVERYDALLAALGDDVDRPLGEIQVWSERDRRIIGGANATAAELPAASVLDLVAARVAASPGAVALTDGDREVTYAELWNTALATRDLLRGAGVEPGSVVALLTRRGPELAAAALGVWLAGAVYLPLDPDHPQQRIAYQLEDSAAGVVIADPGLDVPGAVLHPVPVGEAGQAPRPGDREPLPECAYLIYTSGSTGRPKGTLVTHANLVNLIEHFAAELEASPDAATLWLTTFSFDISALELFLPLATGGRVIVAPDEARTDGSALRDTLLRHRPGIVQATPTTWRLVIAEVASHLAGVRVLSGGEPLPPALAARLAATGCELRNVYGPTETTIWSTSGLIEGTGEGRVHVGRPIANTEIFVAGPGGSELPVGLRGELCIAGTGVAVGYHGRPELTADRFGENPARGRFYRTGDLARWLPDGNLEIVGRLDRQIKLRGNRIELGEVESVLGGHPAVKAAAVVVVDDPDTGGVLTAFVIPADGGEIAGDLWDHARTLLPRSAVPQEFVPIDAFPTTGNDKVDYPALTRLAAERRTRARGQAADPGSGDETIDMIIGVWGELLGTGGLTPASNFFASGGHSLLGARMLQTLHERTGVRLKLADLFADATPEGIARRLR
ncbi:amino acid adenylation domain-containing protein [Microbispora sp. NPDC049125]|uniref:non-ribosomal peptide synthetase n=1 Tax=Microbispora sp. NPDC049125 TaxID=3154929 RepID=UPI003467A444